eukprot:505362_1
MANQFPSYGKNNNDQGAQSTENDYGDIPDNMSEQDMRAYLQLESKLIMPNQTKRDSFEQQWIDGLYNHSNNKQLIITNSKYDNNSNNKQKTNNDSNIDFVPPEKTNNDNYQKTPLQMRSRHGYNKNGYNNDANNISPYWHGSSYNYQ